MRYTTTCDWASLSKSRTWKWIARYTSSIRDELKLSSPLQFPDSALCLLREKPNRVIAKFKGLLYTPYSPFSAQHLDPPPMYLKACIKEVGALHISIIRLPFETSPKSKFPSHGFSTIVWKTRSISLSQTALARIQ